MVMREMTLRRDDIERSCHENVAREMTLRSNGMREMRLRKGVTK